MARREPRPPNRIDTALEVDLLLQLAQFILRLAFGLTLGMALVSPKQVTSGYFRNTSYVVLGLGVLGTLVCLSEGMIAAAWLAGVGAFFGYVCSVMWMYEKAIVGRGVLVVASLSMLASAWSAMPSEVSNSEVVATFARYADAPAGGAVLGFTMAAMLLGHWYLNSPTMQIAPLERLLGWVATALIVRALIALLGLALEPGLIENFDGLQWAFLAIRWLSGILGPLLLTWMAWRTLKIPNTQSATGILYVAVITTFTGELSAQLLSAQTLYPL